MESFRHNDVGRLRKHLHMPGLRDETLSLVSGFVDYLQTLSSQRNLLSVYHVASTLINIESRTFDKSHVTRHVCEWLIHTRNHEEMFRLDADRYVANKINQIWSVLLALHIVIIPESSGDDYFGHMPRMLRDTEAPRAVVAGLKAIGLLTELFVDEKVGLVSQLRSENNVLREKVSQLEEQIRFLERHLSQLQEQRDVFVQQQAVLDGLVSRVEQGLGKAIGSALTVTRLSHDAYPELTANLKSAISEISETVDRRLRPVVVNDVHIREALDRINKVVEDLKSSPTTNAHPRSTMVTDEEISSSWHLPAIRDHYWNYVPNSSNEKIVPIVIDDWQAAIDVLRPQAWTDVRQAIEQNIVLLAGHRKVPCLVFPVLRSSQNSATSEDRTAVSDILLNRMNRVVRGNPVALYTHDDLSIMSLGPIPARECLTLFEIAKDTVEVALTDIIGKLDLTYKLHSPNVYRRLRNLIDAGLIDKSNESHYRVQVPTNGYPVDRYQDSIIRHQAQTERIVDISLMRKQYEQPDWIAALITRLLSIIYRTEFRDNLGETIVITERDSLALSLPTSSYGTSYSHLIKGLLFEHHRIEFTFVD